jgi:hypothetical protein
VEKVWNVKIMREVVTRCVVASFKATGFFYGRTKRNLCVTVKIKIYDRICIYYVMTRFLSFASPVGCIQAAIVADLLPGVVVAAAAAAVAAAETQQVRRKSLRSVEAKQRVSNLNEKRD